MCVRWLALGALMMAQSVAAQHTEHHALEVFARLTPSTVAVGMTFTVAVEVYAEIHNGGDVERLHAALDVATFAQEGTNVEFIAAHEPMGWQKRTEAGRLWLGERTYTFRATASGPVRTPTWQFALGEEAVTLAPLHGLAYVPEAAVQRAAVLPIVAERPTPEPGRYIRRSGSAFAVGPNALITSFHVVGGASKVFVTLPNGRRVTSRRAWVVDPERDIVILHLGGRALEKAEVQPLKMAELTALAEQSEVVYTHGWPGGAQRLTAGLLHQGTTLSTSDLQWFSTNAVRPGDSGGPLLDANGHVLGVVSSGMAQAGQQHVLSEELCVATDPRPALHQLRWTAKPRRLTAWWRDEVVAGAPYALARLWMGRSGLDLRKARPVTPAHRAALAHAPDPELHFLTGALLQLQGDATAARDAYETTLQLHDGHFAAAYLLGVQHLRERRAARAYPYFEQARRSPAYTHLATYGLARAHMGRLMYQQAIPLLQDVLLYDATFGPALFDLALCYWAVSDAVRLEQVRFKLDQQYPYWSVRLHHMLDGHAIPPVVLNAPAALPSN